MQSNKWAVESNVFELGWGLRLDLRQLLWQPTPNKEKIYRVPEVAEISETL